MSEQDPAARADHENPDGPEAPADDPTHDETTGEQPPQVRAADVVDPATVRRAPRYGRFIVMGVLVGAFLAFLLSVLPIGASDTGTGTLFVFLWLGLGMLGALVGAVVASWLDRRSVRRRDRAMARAREKPHDQ